MPTTKLSLLIFVALTLFTAPLVAEPPPIPHHQDKPPGPALSPQEAIAKMTVPDGFEVELVAAEPDIVNPVAMTFDEQGRIWITESVEYPAVVAGPGPRPHQGAGRYRRRRPVDKTTIFAEGLNIPSGIAVGYGGVWVANAPDILFLQDTDGDLKADTTRSGRHRIRPRRHARIAQLPHLGAGRLAVRPQRRIQPQSCASKTATNSTSPARCSASTPARASSNSSAKGPATPGASPGIRKGARSSAPV